MGARMLETVNARLSAQGLLCKAGTLVDATIIAAPSSCQKGLTYSLPVKPCSTDIARLLDGRPRQTLNWKTPEVVMTEEFLNPTQPLHLTFEPKYSLGRLFQPTHFI